ncbi:MAG: hypothetical protein WCV99_06680 [Sterolibacterium sp.]
MRRAFAILLFTTALAAFGHGGEDHDAPPPPVSRDVAPRAVAVTEEFEVVAVLEGRQLVLYIDRFASNEPVTGAKVEVESPGLKGLANEIAQGTYVMKLAAALPPAKHDLTISIEAGDTTDLLTATLDTSVPSAAPGHAVDWTKWIFGTVVALVILVSGIRLVARHYREKAKGISR